MFDTLLTAPWPTDNQLPEDSRAPWESRAGIEDVRPDGMLALVLEEVDVTAVDDRTLVETVAAWQRLVAWAELNSTLAAAELSRRPSMNPNWNLPAPSNLSVAGDELAMRLSWSRRAAERLVRDGRALENEMLLTAEAVRAGTVDGPRMRVLTDRLHDRAPQLAWAVQEEVLAGVETRTPRQLATDLDRALLAVDPVDAADRLARAVAARHVCRPKRLRDGMAGIWAVLPATSAARVDGLLEATARAAHALGDPRTIDQLRADVLACLASGELQTGGGGRSESETAAVSETSAGRGGPAGSLPAGDPAQTWDVDTRDRAGNDLRKTDAPENDLQQIETPGDGLLTSARCDDEATGGVRTRRSRGAPPIRIPRVRIDVTVALSTLMGLDERPAELAGFGPISADQARALAAGGVWRRLVTDPLTGRVLDVGRTRYRPPGWLAEHVRARDVACAAPGCPVPAGRCEIDHTVEFHGAPGSGAAGQTAADNLGPLSHRCHRIKTDGGFSLRQMEPGVFEWRTPAGLTYRVVPGDHGRTERLRDDPNGPNPGYPDEPPF